MFTDVRPGMVIHQTESFGPVQVVLRANTLNDAIRFKLEAEAGMIDVNVGIPAPVASLPFGGMKPSQFSHIKAQGRAIVSFFTQEMIATERYWPEA